MPRWNLRRRRFLRGFGGVMVGLPFLEALAPRKAAAAPGAIKRFGVFFCCNGVNMDRWFPSGDFGALTDAHLTGTANEPLIPFRDKLLFPRGVHMAPRGFARDGGGGDDHGKGMAHKLTAQFCDDADWLALGPSVDHVIAQSINPAGRAPLNLMVGNAGSYKGLGYISYRGAGDAVAAINNPWNAYADFMNLNNDEDEEAQEALARLAMRRQSVLDLVRDQFDDLKRGPLSAYDKTKLDAHFTAIREIETGLTAGMIGCAEDDLIARAMAFDGVGDLVYENDQYPAISALMVDIMALALACDATRVATLHFDRGSGGPTFNWEGMGHEYNHHKLSHGKVRDDCFGDSTEDGCDDVVGYEDMLYEIDRWHQAQLARLLEKLDGYVEADGRTVLDNSVILYTNELSDGKDHSYMDLPYLLAGSAGGYLRQGEYIQVGETGYSDDSTPHNQLLNTVVNAMGIDSDWFGAEEGGETMQGGVVEALLT